MPIQMDPTQRRNLGYPPDPSTQATVVQANRAPLDVLHEKVRVAAATGRVHFLPWLDQYTRETPQMRRTYREMWKSPVVKAALLGKTFAVASLDLQTHATDDTPRAAQIADFTRDAILSCQGGLLKIAETVLLPALMDGHSIAEKKLWPAPRGKWRGFRVFEKLKGKDTESGPAVKLITDEYANVTGVRAYGYGQADIWDPKGFVILSYLSLFESPSGMSDLRAVYAPYWRLDTVEKLRIIHLEKYTSPLLKGTYPADDTTAKASVEAAMEQAKGGTWFSVPENVLVEAMQIAMRGEAEFQAAVADYKEDIALAISGAFLQMLTSRGGGGDMRGDANTQKGTAELFVWYLAELLAQTISQQMVPNVIDPNWADADYPRITLGGVNDSELLTSAQLDGQLLTNGMVLSKKERYRYYGRAMPADQADELRPAAAATPPAPFSSPTEGEQRRPFRG